MSDRICQCGHAEDDHGHDSEFIGSTACREEGCECIAFDHDPDAELSDYE